MTDTSDKAIARTRVKGVMTRLALAGLACALAYLLHPAIWPAWWLAVYCAAQAVDYALFLAVLRDKPQVREWHLLTSLVANVLIFSSITAYNWFFGGGAGKMFAAISICCSLINAVLTMYYRKQYLYASLIPHAAYLLGLPIITLALSSGAEVLPMAVVIVSIVTYLVYLMTAVRTLNDSMVNLQQAGDVAHDAQVAAENANAAKSNFLAVITHEIRTPMNAVVSAVTLLRKTPLNETQKAHLSMLGDASEVLLGLLNDVLDLSKIEAGKMTFERSPIDLADMLHNLEALFLPQAREKGLEIKTVVARDLDSHVVSDPLRLRQILFNLVSNAVKFTAKGSVWLRVRQVDGQIIFAVEDEGVGIAAEDIERIFSSFEQGEAATTRRFGGTGLGLAISRKLARLMGGDITVRSQVGRGSCFYLSLPYEVARRLPEPEIVLESVVEASEEAAMHVLIVDDHEVNRRIVSLFLEPMGWAWTMADNGEAAIELCHQRKFDVILMDMQMPGIDGITATRNIRSERGPNQLTPIIALTANAMDYHKKAWAEVGVYDFLTKPIEPDWRVGTLQKCVPTASSEDAGEAEELRA
ncbi:MAG TPA: ATP-binding protein [Asticcacaulis sp.]|nr:ATP-binding protein [Asticcacaulis sp.]